MLFLCFLLNKSEDIRGDKKNGQSKKEKRGTMEFITKYWLEFIFGLLATGVISYMQTIKHKFEKSNKDYEAIREGMKALLRAEIIATYNHYVELAYMPIYARENLHDLYSQYKTLGGNGAIDSIVEIAFDWSTKEPEKNS